ncbi:MAG: SDR family oxidoreductase [Chloroflexota bacterium]|nr:MAG: SDR family oxidoreductase [Chloroflexota bacterium]
MTPRPRTVLITGSTGIAAATAEMLAANGDRVFIVSRTEANCRALVDRLGAAGGEAAYHVADLTDEVAVDEAVAAAVAHYGRIDAVFNVAGISGRRFGDGPVHSATLEGWQTTIASNLTSMFLVCRAVVRHMLDQDWGPGGERGAILNMASVLAFSPSAPLFGTHAYAASKGGIISLSQSMAAYYGPKGIRVNAIAPGLTRTPMSQRAQLDPAIHAFAAAKQPLVGGMLDPNDIASVAAFLLGPASQAITGQVIAVDGGWTVSEGAVTPL